MSDKLFIREHGKKRVWLQRPAISEHPAGTNCHTRVNMLEHSCCARSSRHYSVLCCWFY